MKWIKLERNRHLEDKKLRNKITICWRPSKSIAIFWPSTSVAQVERSTGSGSSPKNKHIYTRPSGLSKCLQNKRRKSTDLNDDQSGNRAVLVCFWFGFRFRLWFWLDLWVRFLVAPFGSIVADCCRLCCVIGLKLPIQFSSFAAQCKWFALLVCPTISIASQQYE